MSEFGDLIRDARLSTRSLAASAAAPVIDPPPRLRGVSDEERPEPPPPAAVERDNGPAAEELEGRELRIAELARKIDALNAALLQELVQVPGGATEYPRTLAALAGELVSGSPVGRTRRG
jgi:hypothetical protein